MHLKSIYPIAKDGNLSDVVKFTQLAELKAREFLADCDKLKIEPHKALDKIKIAIKPNPMQIVRGFIGASSLAGSNAEELELLRETLSYGQPLLMLCRDDKVCEALTALGAQIGSTMGQSRLVSIRAFADTFLCLYCRHLGRIVEFRSSSAIMNHDACYLEPLC